MTKSTKRVRRLWDAYAFPGFRPEATVKGVFGDPKARVIPLHRRTKKPPAAAADAANGAGTTAGSGGSGTSPVATRGSISNSRCAGSSARPVAR